uniref:32 kDa protein Crp32 n=1 Tax=Cotesia rubecula TaxID=32392 RepID=O76293_COTRU|nr:32 kDa protein Crp32 [Cotesia rubecula]
MDKKIIWSIIIAGVVVIAGAAIWGIWSLWKEFKDPKEEHKLKEELNEAVEKASADAVDAFITTKSDAFIGDKAKLDAVKTGATITIAEADITRRKTELKNKYDAGDQAKIDNVDKAGGSKPTEALDKAKATATTKIDEKAKEIARKLISQKIKEKVSKKNEEAAKSATADDISNLVKKGSSADNAAKDKIIVKAKDAAGKKVNDIISDTVWSEIERAVQTEGNEPLKSQVAEINKNKDTIIDDAILTVAGLPKKG